MRLNVITAFLSIAPCVRMKVLCPWRDLCDDGASPNRGRLAAGGAPVGARRATGRRTPARARPWEPDEATDVRTYAAELKDSIVAGMLPPAGVGVSQLVRETGIPRDTLYGWRHRALAQGVAAATAATALGSWSEEKFAAVVETASLTELEVSAFCRHKGIYPELGTWRETCRQANTALPSKAERAERRAEREEVQRLTRELAYQDRALAEAATLLVLQKKVRQIWEESEAAPSPRNGASR